MCAGRERREFDQTGLPSPLGLSLSHISRWT
jgi:hypothetical protein